MSKLLIITRNTTSYSHKAIISAQHQRGLGIDVLATNDFFDLPQVDNYNAVLHRDTGITFDDVDLIITQHAKDSDVPVINDPYFVRQLRSKDSQSLFLRKNKVSQIETLIMRGHHSVEKIYGLLKPLHEQFILKTIRGNGGIGVMLINGHQSLQSILESNKARCDERYILQPFLKFQKEYRILLLENKILGVLEKALDTDFRANLKRSFSKAVSIEQIPKDVHTLIESIMRAAPFQFLGLDIGVTNEQAYVIEVNPVPGFEIFDKMNNIKVAELLLDICNERKK